MSRNTALSAISAAAAILFAPLAANSQPKVDPGCVTREGQQDSCSPLVACIGDAGTYFTGRAFGWGEGGTLSGTTNAGYACKGTWISQNIFGAGQANLTCSNGLQVVVFYTSIDPRTGTVIGHGSTTDHQQVDAWSGQQIKQFLINETGDVDARLMCGKTEIPIS